MENRVRWSRAGGTLKIRGNDKARSFAWVMSVSGQGKLVTVSFHSAVENIPLSSSEDQLRTTSNSFANLLSSQSSNSLFCRRRCGETRWLPVDEDPLRPPHQPLPKHLSTPPLASRESHLRPDPPSLTLSNTFHPLGTRQDATGPRKRGLPAENTNDRIGCLCPNYGRNWSKTGKRTETLYDGKPTQTFKRSAQETQQDRIANTVNRKHHTGHGHATRP
ncbi:hypothetical protein CROQUDRAFT_104431 [Cronartium quercuum f. sp. fusiforme G11]|uniref:Uncharacterized protein n=1 Tax=Cronartium quercuum f. sp. fusiforme G11 TaxID=708437 RepID=A0A9P6NVQ5_9BASI|nr:hypothetical protein CROQUDRAFT_104431 [Cronartium quercuum f. sp. fusiforme G11]